MNVHEVLSDEQLVGGGALALSLEEHGKHNERPAFRRTRARNIWTTMKDSEFHKEQQSVKWHQLVMTSNNKSFQLSLLLALCGGCFFVQNMLNPPDIFLEVPSWSSSFKCVTMEWHGGIWTHWKASIVFFRWSSFRISGISLVSGRSVNYCSYQIKVQRWFGKVEHFESWILKWCYDNDVQGCRQRSTQNRYVHNRWYTGSQRLLHTSSPGIVDEINPY